MENTTLLSKLDSLAELLNKLKEILHEQGQNASLQEFLLYAAEKKAEEVVELAVSLNQELLRQKGRLSRSYYDSFIDLKLFSVFSEPDLQELASTAGFRNRLAQDYLEINPQLALQAMKKMVKIYPTYLQTIKKIISKQK